MITDPFTKSQQPQPNLLTKSDNLRRGRFVKVPQPNPTAWMTPQVQPTPNMESMMAVLQQSPGITPELLRQIMEEQRRQKQNMPVNPPGAAVGAANYLRPL